MMEHDFELRYVKGDVPWEHGMADPMLAEGLALAGLKGGRALDIGSGLGTQSFWLAAQGFEVVGCDLAQTAVRMATERIEAGMAIRFEVLNILEASPAGAPFDLVVDRGCFHSVAAADRSRFVDRVAALLTPGGYWISLIGNADEGERDSGPPQMTAGEVVLAVEAAFEVVMLKSGLFVGGPEEAPPRAWLCLLRRRS
jgi:methyl halide transferase